MINWFLDESWENLGSIAVYGYGRVAKANIDMIIDDFSVAAIIDNDPALAGKTYRGVPIFSFSEYKSANLKTDKIVITATGRALKSIKGDLLADGKKENVDFSDLSTFVNEWYLRFKDQLNLGRVAQPITQKCTFKCKDCQLLMPYIDNPEHDSAEMTRRDVDAFFSLVDYVSDFDIIGGEPLLAPTLNEHICYVSDHYGQKIGNLQLITNASMLPSEDLLSILKNHNIHVRISDYSHVIPYEKRVNEVIELLKKNDIRYTLFSDMIWTDFGYPFKNACTGESQEEQKEHMVECNGGMSRFMHNGRLYFCNPAGGAYDAGLFPLEEGDSLELSMLTGDRDNGRRMLQLYCMGIMKNGAMSICRYCEGYCGGKEVPAGVQL